MPGRAYVGKSGQLATMSEFLLRGYNVAMPEVDIGDDIFVVHDAEGELWRIQVKTSNAEKLQTEDTFRGQFGLAMKQLDTPKQPDLIYVLALRKSPGQWEFVVIPRATLLEEVESHGVGSRSADGKTVNLSLTFRRDDVTGYGRSFEKFRDSWAAWPITES